MPSTQQFCEHLNENVSAQNHGKRLKVESSDKNFSEQESSRARKPKARRQLALATRRAEPTPPFSELVAARWAGVRRDWDEY